MDVADIGQVELDPTIDFIAGTLAGSASLIVGFPFDTVKVRFQNPEIAIKYRSTLDAVRTIVREERFLGLYKGITSPLATVALMNGLVFASYRFFMRAQLQSSDSIPSLVQIALAGASSGIVSSIVTTPTELIKIRQQSLLIRTSARQVAREIFKDSGVRGLYRGIGVTALRDCGYGAYFAAYEATCRYLSPRLSHFDVENGMTKLSIPALLLAGGVAGIVGWVVTFPLDVVKTRVQGSQPIYAPVSPSATTNLPRTNPSKPVDINPYRSMLSTIIYSYRNEGLNVFFRGLTPTILRAIPVNMVTFLTFEAVVQTLS